MHVTQTKTWSSCLRRAAAMLLLLLAVGTVIAAAAPRAAGDKDPIDWDKAQALFQRSQRGDRLTDDEQAYLDRAKAERQRGGGGSGAGAAAAPTTRPGAAAAGDIDMARARELLRRSQQGEKLTAEEQAYLQRAREIRARGGAGAGAGGQPVGGAPPATQTTGLVPLNQMSADDRHKGEDGGLYGGGKNEPPAAHLKAAQAAAAAIAPLDAAGKPSPADGKVVLMSIGMSNTTQEFSRFKQIADADAAKHPQLVIVDSAQGGRDSAAWVINPDNPERSPGTATWAQADRRLKAAGVTPEQVQVIWVKQALIQQGRHGEFPAHAKVMQKDLVSILNEAKRRFPNLRLAYLSSRIYAGYATTPLNPEPYAYEGAFAVRWLIQDQIKGEASLNYDAAKGDVKAPVALWGPYLWSDGTKGRKSDTLAYTRDDLVGDGTHPSNSGRQKVAEQLLTFFKNDATAKGWFVK